MKQSFAATCSLEIILLREASQTEEDKCHMISLICGILKKYKTGSKSTIHKTEINAKT